MKFESKVFGPLNFRQTVIFGLSAIIIYLLLQKIAFNIALPISILIGLLALYYIFTAPKGAAFTEENLKQHKLEVGQEKFDKEIKKMRAQLQSQIMMRKEKGLIEDPKLKEGLEMLERISKPV